MSNNLHNELKKEFQLARMVLFSDAIFAVAITLLAMRNIWPTEHWNYGALK